MADKGECTLGVQGEVVFKVISIVYVNSVQKSQRMSVHSNGNTLLQNMMRLSRKFHLP